MSSIPVLHYSRISLRKDTCNIVAISLNTSEKTSPVIWHANALPYDCSYALPVPRPIGQYTTCTIHVHVQFSRLASRFPLLHISYTCIYMYIRLSGLCWGLLYLSFLSVFLKLVCYAHVFPCMYMYMYMYL